MMPEKDVIPEKLLPQVREGAEQAVRVCAGVKAGERVVVVADETSRMYAQFLQEQVRVLGANLEVVNIPDFGTRPLGTAQGARLVAQVSGADVALVCTTYFQKELASFLHPLCGLTDQEPVRMALLFDLDNNLMTQGLRADYSKIRSLNSRLLDILQPAREIRVTTKAGTDFTAQLGYRWVSFDGFPSKGKWVNLPDGEVLTCPKNINGKLVVDGVIEEFDSPKFGLLQGYPLSLEMKDGRVVLESLSSPNKDLVKFVRKNLLLDANAARIGELALGTNIFLTHLVGNLSQDEKYPSIHLAWGDPYGSKTGANWTSIQHMDAVIKAATVIVDRQLIMTEGKYLDGILG
ncbi:aminopeptidase [Patescibacteria group bacterium]